MKVQENQVRLNLNGARLFLAYPDNMILLEDNIDTIMKNTDALTDANREVGLEIHIEKTKYRVTDGNRTYFK
jgi:hypothetical protein